MGDLHVMKRVSLHYAVARKLDRWQLAGAAVRKWDSDPCNKSPKYGGGVRYAPGTKMSRAEMQRTIQRQVPSLKDLPSSSPLSSAGAPCHIRLRALEM